MKELDSHIFFSYALGVGPKTFLKLLSHFGSAGKIYFASENELIRSGLKGKALEKYLQSKSTFEIKTILQKLIKAKVEYISYDDKFYPESLKEISDPPIGLFIKGNKNLLLEKNQIAVVGTRKVTSYGREVTRDMVSELARNNVVITSGMAFGVDSIAHKTCIESGGKTIAVLGCGVDCPYPKENEKLYEEILDTNGLIISEYPLGMRANTGTFPARNRIIAGLSSAVLITEAAKDSGSLITADYAFKYGKKVFAVPGPITSNLSKGTNSLLSLGAVAVGSSEQVLQELQIKYQKQNIKNTIEKFGNLKLTKDEQKIIKALENEEMSIDEIARKTKVPISKLMIIITELEIKNVLRKRDGKLEIFR